nr:zinc finger BED domain-containing protein 4-like [Pseudochaenichthys georgianus]
MKSTLLESVNTRFADIYSDPLYCIATVLDPRYTDNNFDAGKKQSARDMIQAVLDKENPREEAAAHSTGDVTQTTEKRARLSTAEEEEERGQPPSLSDMFNEIMEENTTPNRLVTSSTAQQLDDYLSEVPIPRSENPLGYWRNKQDRFPDLAKVARKYLSAPCTSTDSERLFSAASHVLDEKRNRLMADKAEKLLFIKKNLPRFLNK